MEFPCAIQAFATCRRDPCSTECGEAIASKECAPFADEIGKRVFGPQQLGPESPICIGNSCARKVNEACSGQEENGSVITRAVATTAKICSQGCADAISSIECMASQDKVPEELKAVAGPDSQACAATECAILLAQSCGNLTSDALGDAPQQLCSEGVTPSSPYIDYGGICVCHPCGSSLPLGLLRCFQKTTGCFLGFCTPNHFPAFPATVPQDSQSQNVGLPPAECAAAFATPQCQQIPDYAGIASRFGPSGLFCTGQACIAGLQANCALDANLAPEINAALGILPKICSAECKVLHHPQHLTAQGEKREME